MTQYGGVSGDQLRTIIQRIEQLEREKKEIADFIRDVYAEAKSGGFDTKAIRSLIKIRKLDSQTRIEQEEILDIYKHALGMIASNDSGDESSEAA